MADATHAESAPPAGSLSASQEKKYTLRWESVDPFTEEELFINGCVRGKIWVSESTSVIMKSLTGEEVDEVNKSVRLDHQMPLAQYNTEITYHNIARSLEQIGDRKLAGSIEDRVASIRKMAAPFLVRLQLALLEFNDHVDDLFTGKEKPELAKKS